tara:strand:- start:163 stop:789 length:627 start_codon:yes stop_codon:yes gene_type:complete
MQGLLKYNYADPDATGVAHDNIDEILAGNRAETAYNIGTIGPTPHYQTEEGQQEMFDIAEGFAFPGSALGRISKGAITGGQQAVGGNLATWLKRALGKRPPGKMSSEEAGIKLKKYFDEMMKHAKGPKPPKVTRHSKGMTVENRRPQIPYELEEQFAEEALSKHNWNNRVNKSRIALEKAYNKFGLPHEIGANDPVTEILRALKYRKN